jgi:hypothetical protein
MTTSKEQQPAIPEESYSREDAKIIVSLLNEYSEKLMHVCYKINKQKKKLVLFLLYFGGLITSLILLLYTVWLKNFTFNSVLASGELAESIFKLALIISIFTPISVFIIVTFYEIKQNIKQFIIDANILASKLEKIIRIASQVQEHVLSNFVSRLELDLRLAEAELALQHCTDLLKTTRRS